MGTIEGKTHGAMIARALYEIEDENFVPMDKLQAKITMMEYDKGNYISLTPDQIKAGIGEARKLLEDKSDDGLTIEAKESDGKRERKGSHIAYRVYKGTNIKQSYLMQNLSHRRKQAKALLENLNKSVQIAMKQEADNTDFLKLLE